MSTYICGCVNLCMCERSQSVVHPYELILQVLVWHRICLCENLNFSFHNGSARDFFFSLFFY